VPNLIEDREEWFNHWDDIEHGGDGTGQMSKKQVVHALRKTFRKFEKVTIESAIEETWASFAQQKDGLLGKDELMRPQSGLIDMAHMVLMWSS